MWDSVNRQYTVECCRNSTPQQIRRHNCVSRRLAVEPGLKGFNLYMLWIFRQRQTVRAIRLYSRNCHAAPVRPLLGVVPLLVRCSEPPACGWRPCCTPYPIGGRRFPLPGVVAKGHFRLDCTTLHSTEAVGCAVAPAAAVPLPQ
jgi:hypothetical protein